MEGPQVIIFRKNCISFSKHLLCVQLASYLEGGLLMWMMPLHLQLLIKNSIMIYDRNFCLTNNEDTDEMPHYVAIHLGLHCSPKYTFKYVSLELDAKIYLSRGGGLIQLKYH